MSTPRYLLSLPARRSSNRRCPRAADVRRGPNPAGRPGARARRHRHTTQERRHTGTYTTQTRRHRHSWVARGTHTKPSDADTDTGAHARAHTHTHTRGSASGPTPRAGRPGQPGADAATVLFGVSQYRSAKSQHRFVHTSPCVRPDAPVEGPGLPQAAQASESVPSESDGWRAGRADIRVGRRRTARGPPPAG